MARTTDGVRLGRKATRADTEQTAPRGHGVFSRGSTLGNETDGAGADPSGFRRNYAQPWTPGLGPVQALGAAVSPVAGHSGTVTALPFW